jgi:tRNA A37 methylthiotransferase MiaB
MYLHPQGVTDRLIDAITASDVVTDYFDLSLQHVSPRVLKGMGRWGGRDRFERMIEKIRGRAPLAGVRATFILGFPGESEAEAREVEDFAGDADLDWIGTFSYSPEEGTRSVEYTEHVPEPTKRERVERVAAVADGTMSRRASSLVGRTLEVLVERLGVGSDEWFGRSHREAPEVDGEIRFKSHARPKVGDYVDVEITATEGADLIGRRVGV